LGFAQNLFAQHRPGPTSPVPPHDRDHGYPLDVLPHFTHVRGKIECGRKAGPSARNAGLRYAIDRAHHQKLRVHAGHVALRGTFTEHWFLEPGNSDDWVCNVRAVFPGLDRLDLAGVDYAPRASTTASVAPSATEFWHRLRSVFAAGAPRIVLTLPCANDAPLA
jgi:hypothetical protein